MNRHVDIAVVAAGPAGLCAAATALEEGRSVAIFEKNNVPGGTANMGMGPFAVGSKVQQRMMDPLTKEQAFEKFMAYNHWKVDARIVRDYFWRSADTIDWLMSMGVEFVGAMKNFPESHQTWHIVKPLEGQVGPRCAGAMNRKLYEHCIELGGDFYFNTPVKEIIMNDGCAKGVLAVSEQGDDIIIESDAVIIATGGFGTNPEMVKEHTGYDLGKNMIDFMVPGIVGDGIRMAWKAGAAKGRMMMEKISGNSIPGASVGQLPQFQCFVQASPICINYAGDRVANEFTMQNPSVSANIADIQPDKNIYRIMDTGILKHLRRDGMEFPSEVNRFIDPTENFEEAWEDAEKQYPGCAFNSDSLEEIAEKMKVPVENFIETVERYNDFCEMNYDDDFCKPRDFLCPIRGKRFYAYRLTCGAYGSLGGIKINHRYEVLREDGDHLRRCTLASDSDEYPKMRQRRC